MTEDFGSLIINKISNMAWQRIGNLRKIYLLTSEQKQVRIPWGLLQKILNNNIENIIILRAAS